MKTGIMGTHGTGKTTYALRLAANLKHLQPGNQIGILGEVVRSCPFLVNQDATEEAQRWIFHEQFVREIEESSRNETLICDRTVLDSLAYSQRAGFHDLVGEAMPLALRWMKTYDELYFLQPDTDPPADDGFRDTDRAFQMEIDRILAGWVIDYKIPATRVVILDQQGK